jgi:hypothetical protein
MTKLTAGQTVSGSNEDNIAEIAVLAVRLMLTFEPTREAAIDTENRLVEGYMRYAFSVPAHREYLRSGAPSEPILAEAAARIMSSYRPIRVVEKLDNWSKNGLISKGERGELVARLLLTFAHDTVIEKLGAKCPQIHYSRPILLTDFIVALVGEERAKPILDSHPQNVANGPTFKEAFKEARMHFTHFGKASDSSALTDEAAYIAMCRGMAFICHNTQVDTDIMLPILLRNEHLSRYVMSALLIQIKNQFKLQAVHIDAEKLHFFTPGGGDRAESRPYVALTLHLGVQPQRGGGNAVSKVVTEPGPTRKMPSRKVKASHPKHPRYAFSIHGCSSAVYDIIEPSHEAIYANLLASKDFLDEHPRQSPELLNAVERMKPFWHSGQQSYDWVEPDPKYPEGITGHVAGEEDGEEDRVEVHGYEEELENETGDVAMEVDSGL